MSKQSRIPEPVERLAFTVDEARSVLRLSRTSIYALMAQGKLKYVPMLDGRRIPRTELERVIQNGVS
jgi:excisionase family DNA binding protein